MTTGQDIEKVGNAMGKQALNQRAESEVPLSQIGPKWPKIGKMQNVKIVISAPLGYGVVCKLAIFANEWMSDTSLKCDSSPKNLGRDATELI